MIYLSLEYFFSNHYIVNLVQLLLYSLSTCSMSIGYFLNISIISINTFPWYSIRDISQSRKTFIMRLSLMNELKLNSHSRKYLNWFRNLNVLTDILRAESCSSNTELLTRLITWPSSVLISSIDCSTDFSVGVTVIAGDDATVVRLLNKKNN